MIQYFTNTDKLSWTNDPRIYNLLQIWFYCVFFFFIHQFQLCLMDTRHSVVCPNTYFLWTFLEQFTMQVFESIQIILNKIIIIVYLAFCSICIMFTGFFVLFCCVVFCLLVGHLFICKAHQLSHCVVLKQFCFNGLVHFIALKLTLLIHMYISVF